MVLVKGGVVFGASLDEDGTVFHTYIESVNELKKFRNSKYVQSNVLNTYKQVKHFLDDNRLVIYSGTPCQIEGLNAYLNKKYNNLILIDLVCRSVPSPKVWQQYLNYKIEDERPSYISFRNKEQYGYQYSKMVIKTSNKSFSNGIDTDAYLRLFFQDLSIRPSCYECPFKTVKRVSDITLWDCFDSYKFTSKIDINSGVTRVLTHTDKGVKLIEELSNCKIIEIDRNKAIFKVNELTRSTSYNPKRTDFFDDLLKLNPDTLFNKWAPKTLRTRMEKIIRVLTIKLHIYIPIKKLARRILRKD